MAIIIMLLNRKKISARELAEHFEVSSRTIYRDMEALNMAGLPIISYQGNEGGFAIMENFKLDRQFFTPEEFSMLMISLQGLATAVDDTRVSSTIEKIKTIMPAKNKTQNRKKFPPLILNLQPWGQPAINSGKLQLLRQAIEQRRILSFSYTSVKGQTTDRQVEPLTLIIQGVIWYLFAYCLLRKDYRLFKISRIEQEKLGAFFKEREYDLQEFPWEKAWEDSPPVSIVLKFSKDVAMRVKENFPNYEISKNPDGSLLVSFSSSLGEWIYSLILSYGQFVEVLEPEFLRTDISQRLKKTINLYS